MSRGVPHESSCPFVLCQMVYGNLQKAVQHLVSSHNKGVCPICKKIVRSDEHYLLCTMNVKDQCTICEADYFVKYANSHYARHVSHVTITISVLYGYVENR